MVNCTFAIAKLRGTSQTLYKSFEQAKVMLLSIQNTVSLGRPLVPWSIVKVKGRLQFPESFWESTSWVLQGSTNFHWSQECLVAAIICGSKNLIPFVVTSNSPSVVKDYACKYTKEKLYCFCDCVSWSVVSMHQQRFWILSTLWAVQRTGFQPGSTSFCGQETSIVLLVALSWDLMLWQDMVVRPQNYMNCESTLNSAIHDANFIAMPINADSITSQPTSESLLSGTTPLCLPSVYLT